MKLGKMSLPTGGAALEPSASPSGRATAAERARGKTYHVDPAAGDDANDGLAPAHPFRTWASREFSGGDAVLFRRGSVIRDVLYARSGDEQAPITYGAYGEGHRPTFLGSVRAGDPDEWVQVRPSLWRHTGAFASEVCNLIFNDGQSCGILRWQIEDLRKPGDWHYTGISATPAIVGDRAYVVTHAAEVLCLDVNGLADGNAGPYTDEGTHMVKRGREPLKPLATDADIVWIYDMPAEVGVVPHNAVTCSILVRGDLLYVCTSNGVDWTHKKVPNPAAPSMIVLNRKTGKLVARDNANIGPKIYHGQWSSPSFGLAGDRNLVFFGGGDGVCYAFDPPSAQAAGKSNRQLLRTAWSFTCDPKARFTRMRAGQSPPDPNGPSVIIGMPVIHAGRVYVAAGGDPWHGKSAGALHCIDAAGKGDITASGRLWSYSDLNQSVSTPAIADGLVYIASYDGRVHCLDAKTGKAYWVHDTGGRICGSPLLADGKIYIGTLRRDLWVLAAGKKMKVLGKVRLSARIHSSAVAANGTLFIASGRHLYAAGK